MYNACPSPSSFSLLDSHKEESDRGEWVRERGRERGREGGRERGREGVRERGRERGREGGRERGREGVRERGREREREGGREGGRGKEGKVTATLLQVAWNSVYIHSVIFTLATIYTLASYAASKAHIPIPACMCIHTTLTSVVCVSITQSLCTWICHCRCAFLHFCSAKRPKLKQENPSLSVGALAKQLSSAWKLMTPEQKKPYDILAEKDKQRYA